MHLFLVSIANYQKMIWLSADPVFQAVLVLMI